MESAGIQDTRQFRDALGTFTTGVTIVTTRDREGNDVGLTVNSFNSVSLDPPMVLWSLARTSGSLQAFQDAEFFAVHVLAADQESLSNLFSRRGADKFAGQELSRGPGNIPLLDGCAARFVCRSAFRHDGGDHEIFVGKVEAFEKFGHPPLVFQAGRYALAMNKPAPGERESRDKNEPDYLLASQSALHVLLGLAYHQLSLNLAPELAKFSISEQEYWLLNMVGAESGRSVAQLDDLISFTSKRVTPELARNIADRGYVRLEGTGADARLFITDAGREILIRGAAISKAIEQQAETDLDYSKVQLIKQGLQQIIRSSRRSPGAR